MLLNRPFHPIKHAILSRRQQPGFNECLSYLLMPDEQTILHKDFALSRHFVLTVPDLTARSNVEYDSTAHIWRQSLPFLGDGWMLETNVVSEPLSLAATEEHFSDPISSLLHHERLSRANSGYYFSTTLVLSLTYKPKNSESLQQRCFSFKTGKMSLDTVAFQHRLETFDHVVADFTGFLSQVCTSLHVLNGDGLVQFLHQCITGDNQPITAPCVGSFLDNVLASEDFMAGITPKIGEQYIQVLALDQLPRYSYPAILGHLSQFPMAYRWSTRFIPLGKNSAEAYLKRYQRHWSSKAIGALGVIRESLGLPIKYDRDAQQVANDLDDCLVNQRAGQIGFGFYSSVVVLMHKDKARLVAMAQAIKQTIQQCHFKVREERLNNTEAYLGSLPGHGGYNVRKILVDLDYLSHALPITQPYQGQQHAPCPLAGYRGASHVLLTKTSGNRPFFLNLHVNDVGHSVILGATGSGKSTLVSALLCAHRRYADSQIVVFDKDGSQRLTLKALQGDYIDVGKQDIQLAPLALCTPDNQKALDVAFQWLCDFMQAIHITMTADKQQLLRDALLRVAHEEPAFKNLNHLHIEEPSLREGLKALNSGLGKKLLNGNDNTVLTSPVLGIDYGYLLQGNTLSPQAISIIDALFNQLNTRFSEGKPTLLVLEEAWLYLQHPIFQAKLTDWLKTLRKFNVAVILVSQDIADLANSPIQPVIQSACMTRIYCPNRAAKETELAKGYHAFGLSREEIHLLADLVPKREYYYQSALGSQIFQLDLGDFAKTVLCQTNITKRAALERFFENGDMVGFAQWLEKAQLGEWAALLRQYRQTSASEAHTRVRR